MMSFREISKISTNYIVDQEGKSFPPYRVNDDMLRDFIMRDSLSIQYPSENFTRLKILIEW